MSEEDMATKEKEAKDEEKAEIEAERRELEKNDLGYFELPEAITIEDSEGEETKATGVRHTFEGYAFQVEKEGIAEIVISDTAEVFNEHLDHLTVEQVDQIMSGGE